MKRLFSIPGSIVFSIVCAFALNLLLGIQGVLLWFNLALAGIACAMVLLSFSMLQSQPQSVALDQKKKGLDFYSITRLRMPARAVMIYLALLTPFCLILVVSCAATNLHPETVRNVRLFSLSILSSLAIGFTHWAFYWQHYFFASEYDTRVILKAKGHDNESAQRIIDDLYADGYFGPVTVSIEGQHRIDA